MASPYYVKAYFNKQQEQPAEIRRFAVSRFSAYIQLVLITPGLLDRHLGRE